MKLIEAILFKFGYVKSAQGHAASKDLLSLVESVSKRTGLVGHYVGRDAEHNYFLKTYDDPAASQLERDLHRSANYGFIFVTKGADVFGRCSTRQADTNLPESRRASFRLIKP